MGAGDWAGGRAVPSLEVRLGWLETGCRAEPCEGRTGGERALSHSPWGKVLPEEESEKRARSSKERAGLDFWFQSQETEGLGREGCWRLSRKLQVGA